MGRNRPSRADQPSRAEQIGPNGPGRLCTVTRLAAAACAVLVLALVSTRLAQLGWGRHTNSAAHAIVTATRIPVPSPICARALRCRPRYRSVLA